MPFKVKDLMIHVAPAAPAALPCAQGLAFCTYISACFCTHITCGCTHCTAHPSCGCTYVCSVHFSGCTVFTCNLACSHLSACTPCGSAISQITPPTVGPSPEASLSSLAALKGQLQQQLAEVEAQEKAADESMRPQTVAEVDDLMKKLQDAMEELKTRRAELEKK